MAAVVQGGLTRRIIPWLGERRAVIYGILIGAAGFIGYGLATSGWMIYVIIVLASVAGIQNPAVQGIISNSVAANEQGAVQGALTSLASVAGILGPPLVTGMFGYFISPQAPANLPGAAFFLCALLQLLLAVRSFAKSKA
jgi:MFS transporter, DHA1 family, tetracycline resistance protein